MDETLIQSGDHALEKSENLRIARQKQQAELSRNGQMPATYVRTDAEQGLIEVADIYGGRAFLQDQGSLSNRAISDGEEVRLYQDGRSTGYQAADWKPGRAIAGSGGAGGGNGGGDGSGDGDGDGEDPPPYCAIQCFWYRGQPCTDPSEDDPPEPGQCPDQAYNGVWNWEFLQSGGPAGAFWRQVGGYFGNLYAPIEIELCTGGQTCDGYNNRGYPAARLTARTKNPDGSFSDYASNWEFYSFAVRFTTPRARSIYFCRGGYVNQQLGNSAYPAASVRTYPAGGPYPRDPDDRYSGACAVGSPSDDCGNPPPPLGPPPGSDPGKWQAICSGNPPIRYSTNTSGACEVVSVWDQLSSAESPLTKLDFEKGTGQYYVRCQEEGPPA